MRLHTYLSLLTGLTVCPIWLIVQLLGDHAQELSLVFVSVVVRGPYADQLERHKQNTEEQLVLDWLNSRGKNWVTRGGKTEPQKGKKSHV